MDRSLTKDLPFFFSYINYPQVVPVPNDPSKSLVLGGTEPSMLTGKTEVYQVDCDTGLVAKKR